MYIGITGTIGAGKGEVVRVLKQKGFKHYGFGDFIRAELAKQSKEPSAANMRELADSLRKQHGPSYLAELLLHKAQQEAPKHAVFESVRTLAELQTLRRLPGFLLLSINAPREVRYERLKQRGRGDNLESFEAFCAYDDLVMEGAANEQHVAAVMDHADINIVNIGSLEELREQLEEQLNI